MWLVLLILKRFLRTLQANKICIKIPVPEAMCVHVKMSEITVMRCCELIVLFVLTGRRGSQYSWAKVRAGIKTTGDVQHRL